MHKDEVYYNYTGINNDLVFRDSKTAKSIGYIDKITTEIDPFTGFSADITVTDSKFYDQIINLCKYGSIENEYATPPKKYQIKKVIANPKKDATTVIFKDGSVEVVKKSPDDNEADIYSVVAYAIAKHIYGSNSAFQKEVAKNIQFTKDKELNKLINKTSIGELNSALRNILSALKREVE